MVATLQKNNRTGQFSSELLVAAVLMIGRYKEHCWASQQWHPQSEKLRGGGIRLEVDRLFDYFYAGLIRCGADEKIPGTDMEVGL